MKRIALILLGLVMLLSLAVPALAADLTLTASASATMVHTGDEVVITISASGNTSYTSMGFFLKYDTSVFSYKSRSWGAAVLDAETKSFDANSGKVAIVWRDPGAYAGEVIRITLTVIKAVPGTTSITFGTVSCKNINDTVSVGTVPVEVRMDCNHSFSSWTDKGDGTHTRMCSKCDTRQTEEHDWSDGAPNPAPSCEKPGKLVSNCLFCTATKSEDLAATGHKWDNACDTECNNNCGTTREASHSFSNTYSSDKDGHWYACANCQEKKDFAPHTPGPAATEQNPQNCTICDFELSPILPHEHEMSTEWYTDSNYHWYRCNKKGCYYVENKVKHSYDNDCDVDCNVCGHIRIAPHKYNEEWKADATGHWCVCVICGVKSEVMPHVPGPEATETEPQLCEECNFRIKMPLSHVHDYGDAWYSDDTQHWQSCAECNEMTTMQPHEWGEPVEKENGEKEYTCTVCGKVVVGEPEQIPPSSTPSVPNTVPGNQEPVQDDETGGFPWQWAGIAAVVLLIIGIVLLVIEYIRSRKVNMRGRYSK